TVYCPPEGRKKRCRKAKGNVWVLLEATPTGQRSIKPQEKSLHAALESKLPDHCDNDNQNQ
ncbi:hypothetical protein HispidOSU_029860, partial [Sigmodon hispidus]